MKVLLVNDKGQQVASLENLEQYDAGKPGDLLALMNFMERLIATAKGSSERRSSAASSLAGSAPRKWAETNRRV